MASRDAINFTWIRVVACRMEFEGSYPNSNILWGATVAFSNGALTWGLVENGWDVTGSFCSQWRVGQVTAF